MGTRRVWWWPISEMDNLWLELLIVLQFIFKNGVIGVLMTGYDKNGPDCLLNHVIEVKGYIFIIL